MLFEYPSAYWPHLGHSRSVASLLLVHESSGCAGLFPQHYFGVIDDLEPHGFMGGV